MISFDFSGIFRLACILLSGAGIFPHSTLHAQGSFLEGKRVGIYFSSKEFQYTEDYNLPIAQFLSVDDDRSYSGKMKSELLVRLGELLTEQFPGVTGADSVYFINADLQSGRAFINSYDAIDNRIYDPAMAFEGTDYILVMNSLDLSTRVENDVFIRSNRMLTERVRVKKAQMAFTLFDLSDLTSLPRQLESCLDERRSPVLANQFDFYQKRSSLGKFLGRLFTQTWDQAISGTDSTCPVPAKKAP
jgi:hypothetical protein